MEIHNSNNGSPWLIMEIHNYGVLSPLALHSFLYSNNSNWATNSKSNRGFRTFHRKSDTVIPLENKYSLYLPYVLYRTRSTKFPWGSHQVPSRAEKTVPEQWTMGHSFYGCTSLIPISLVPHLIGSPSHWSPISLVPHLINPPISTHASLISLVPHLIGPPDSLVPHLIGPLLIGPPIQKSPTTLFELIGPPVH